MKKKYILSIVIILVLIAFASYFVIQYLDKENIKITYSGGVERFSSSDENKMKDRVIGHYLSDEFGGKNCNEEIIVTVAYNSEKIVVRVSGCGQSWSEYDLEKVNGEFNITKIQYGMTEPPLS